MNLDVLKIKVKSTDCAEINLELEFYINSSDIKMWETIFNFVFSFIIILI